MGIPGMRGGDHIGITVPDMEQAHEFLVGVLGCEFVYSLPEMRHDDDDWMREHLNVDPRRAVREIRFYRCGFGLNFEVFEYEPHDGQRDVPRNCDPRPGSAGGTSSPRGACSSSWSATRAARRTSETGRR